jgi:hypothetical protein
MALREDEHATSGRAGAGIPQTGFVDPGDDQEPVAAAKESSHRRIGAWHVRADGNDLDGARRERLAGPGRKSGALDLPVPEQRHDDRHRHLIRGSHKLTVSGAAQMRSAGLDRFQTDFLGAG